MRIFKWIKDSIKVLFEEEPTIPAHVLREKTIIVRDGDVIKLESGCIPKMMHSYCTSFGRRVVTQNRSRATWRLTPSLDGDMVMDYVDRDVNIKAYFDSTANTLSVSANDISADGVTVYMVVYRDKPFISRK